MSNLSRVIDKFYYHLEDLNCVHCLHKKRKSKFHKNPCHEKTCRYEDIRQEAISHNRIERPRKWDRDRINLGKPATTYGTAP